MGRFFAWTLTLFLGGYDPLLIVRQEDVYPTVPFMLAHEFGSRVAIAQVSDADGAPNAATTARRVDAITRPSLVIPISRYLTQALRSAGEATPTGQWFAPNTVYRMELDCAIEYRYAISESVDPRNAGRLAFSLDPRSGRTVFPFRPTAPDRAEYVASTEEGDDRVARRGPAS